VIEIKRPEEIGRMRRSGRVAAQVLAAVREHVKPGITTQELDDVAKEMIRKLGARSAFLNYRGYPRYICVSINEEVVHGIPGTRRIKEGDIVSIDVGVVCDGYIGDNAATVAVGKVDPEILRLVRTTEEALYAAIDRIRPGRRLGEVGYAIETTARRAGFSVVREFVGHGVGRHLHEDPQVPNFGPPESGPVLVEGMTLAIEPMLNLGSDAVVVKEDGWTAVTADGSPSAHFEHTVVVSSGVAEILTCAGKK